MDRFSANEEKSAEIGYRSSRRAGLVTLSIEESLNGAPCDPDRSRDRAQHQLRRAMRHLEQLSDAAQSFSLQLDCEALLNDIGQHAQRILPVEQVLVYSNIDSRLYAAATAPRTCELHRGPTENVRWCVRYSKPRISNGPDPSAAGLRNSICVPMIATQGRVLGVIEFRNKKMGGLFVDEDLRAAQALARIATSGLDRARLFFRIEEWRQSVETLLSFNATVNQQLEPEQMVRDLVANVTGFLDADGGMAGVLIPTDSEPQLRCEAFYFNGLWSEYSRRWKVGQGIPGTVLQTQFPYLSSDYGTDPLRETDLCRSYATGSCICVPIKNPSEEVLGFFQLHRRLGEPEFTWQDAAFLESLGGTAAVAIENARLVKSLELKTEKIKSLSQDHVRRLEEERRHIARELHDQTGQVLIGLKLRLQILDGLFSCEQVEVKEELTELRSQVNNAAVQLKELAKRLRPPTLDELGFEATLRQLVTEFRKHASFSIELDMEEVPELSNEAETALYRIVQECLTNVAKHANATRVSIDFHSDGRRHILRIADDGRGFVPEESTGGLGQVGMRERVTMLGGEILVSSGKGNGTIVEVILKHGESE